MKKNIVPIIIGIAVLAIIVIFVSSHRNNTSNGAVTETPAVSPSTTTPSAPVTTTTTAAPNTFTLAQIATHNNASSCWTTINGGVYDVTSWINQHPGGSEAILSLCGKDGSVAFNGQHGGQARQASELATFKIGTLAR